LEQFKGNDHNFPWLPFRQAINEEPIEIVDHVPAQTGEFVPWLLRIDDIFKQGFECQLKGNAEFLFVF